MHDDENNVDINNSNSNNNIIMQQTAYRNKKPHEGNKKCRNAVLNNRSILSNNIFWYSFWF